MSATQEIEQRPELIFALVGPAGVRLDDLSRAVKDHLKTFGYVAIEIRLSELLKQFVGWTQESDTTEYTRIKHRQSVAHAFRIRMKHGSALARAAIASIREKRASVTSSPDRPASGHAYIIQQLKHPHEVELLRQVYGSSLVVLAGHAPQAARVKSLALRMAQKDDRPVDGSYSAKAEEIIHIDDKQEDTDEEHRGLGQNTRDTYPLADYFANLGQVSGEHGISRFIDLLFGHPFHTPVPDEYAMYQASAASLRSSDENRQVGAVIVALTRKEHHGKITNADVVASGMNEVPRRGGGFYWHEDSPDGRDQWLMAYQGVDRASNIKVSALTELLYKIRARNWLKDEVANLPANQLAHELIPYLKGTQFMDIGEFMRPVHAEMAALVDSARRGVPVHGLTMYVTTFPCHNCAKHIIAVGLRQVVYLEPYPKSRAQVLHGEEINLDSIDGTDSDDRVVFLAFTGVAPRQYQRVFGMANRGKKGGLALKEWTAARGSLTPKYIIRNASQAYLLAERQELEKLPTEIYKWDREFICPTTA